MPQKTISIEQTPNEKVILVDGELFDWGMDPEDIERAKKFVKKSDLLKRSIQKDIQKHFLDSFAEFLGKAVSLKELNEAIENGYIET